MKKLSVFLLLAVLVLTFAACTQNSGVEHVDLVVTEETIHQLEEYPNLKSANLTGSTCYEAIAQYMKKHPEVKVTYTVNFGDVSVNSTMEAPVLPNGSYRQELLLENLKYLPNLKSLSLPGLDMSGEELRALQAAYPQLDIQYTVKLQGITLDSGATAVDLSQLGADGLEEAVRKLSLLPKVQTVNLQGSTLELSQVKQLQQALPAVVFDYSFQLFGQTVSTLDTRIEFKDVDIGNAGEAQLRQALDVLTGCKYFLLDDCGLDNEVLAGIRADYPGTKVVWRIYHDSINTMINGVMVKNSLLTDTQCLRAVYGVNDSNSGVFQYLTEVKYVDLGHNNDMHDLSFLGYMPNLEMAILSGSEITDLGPLSACKKLEFLELAWCGWLEDISPLAGCDSLKYLNIGHTRVKDLSPLENLPLEMLSYVNSGRYGGFTEAAWKTVQANHPDWWITYSPLKDNNATPYGVGWRYNKDNSYTEAYAKIRQVFELDRMNGAPSVGENENGGNSGSEGGGNNGGQTGPTYTPPVGDAATEKLTLTVTESTIADLSKYPNLKQADLTGSTCYGAIRNFIATHPQVRVFYSVGLGGTDVKHDTQRLTLSEGAYTYEAVLANLQYLPQLRHVTFPDTGLTVQQLDDLQKAYPGISFHYTMQVRDSQLNASAVTADLSAMQSGQVDSYIQQLQQYPNIRFVKLGSQLTVADVKKLQDSCPQVTFHYSFTLGTETVSTTQERIELRGQAATLDAIGEQNLRNALDILDGCAYFLLDNNYAAVDNAAMAAIRDDYPHIKVVWRIYHSVINTYNVEQRYMMKGSLLTDAKVLRAVYGVDDSNSAVFKYLTDVQFVDLGHDVSMKDISFLGYMPDLESCILSGSAISDLSPLANCKKLEFLEVAWCGNVSDVSPLASCDSLRYLNISHTRVKDLSPLYGLDMQMLKYVNSGNRAGLTAADWTQIQSHWPNCWITWDPLYDNNADPYAVGWRAKPGWNGWTYGYGRARAMFGYDYM